MRSNDLEDQAENEFRNIKLKLRGPNRHSELQAVKALMAMSTQQSLCKPKCRSNSVNSNSSESTISIETTNVSNYNVDLMNISKIDIDGTSHCKSQRQRTKTKSGKCREEAIDLSRSMSPEPIYGLSITMTEEEFKVLAEKEGIEDVIGEPICKLCGGLFSGPLGIALHMCPAMKRQTFRCEICGEDKWKTKANLHSHIKWCRKRLNLKIEEH